jgi:ribonucleoside-diphosphate reductase alpha chain
MLGIPFGSEESLELQEKIAKLKAETELLASAELGREKGSFKLFDKDKYFSSVYFKELPISDDVKKKIVEIGEMRNSHQSMNAPTGNTGVYARNVSGGIEPVFSIDGYFRWCIVPEFRQRILIDSGVKFPDVHKSEWFETDIFKFSNRGSEQILKGSIDGRNYEIDKSRGLVIENFVEDYGIKFAKKFYENFEDMKSKNIFKDVSKLSVDDHVNSLKVWAKYCNMSISKTVNLPNDYSYEDFQKVYLNAWKNNIKGITTYREGTMTAVLETKESQKNNKGNSSKISYTDAPKRPERLECDIHQVKIKGESWTIFIGLLDGLPYEIFGGSEKYIKIPKVYNKGILQKDSKKIDMNSQYNLFYGESGKETIIKDIVSVFENPLYNYHTRSLSMKLRHGIPIMFIAEMLQRDELGSELYSFNKVIARVLKSYIKDGTKKKGKCPNCGGEQLVMQEGCYVCLSCSYSKCS